VVKPVLESGQSGPFFFLSYAHTPRRNEGDSLDPDFWITELYRDICRRVRTLTDRHAREIGFMDTDLRFGEWSSDLSRALTSCRVFVPLFSRRYFDSAHCGKEWSAFAERARTETPRGDDGASRMIPALWRPVDESLLPERARNLRFEHAQFGELYAQLGFYQLMKLSRYREEYEQAVYLLAKRIVEVAERTPVGAGLPARYDALDSAFGPGTLSVLGGKRVLVTVVAPDKAHLPGGRLSRWYGATALDWRPYPGSSAKTIAEHAVDLLQAAGYRADVGTLSEHAGELLGDEPPAAPVVLLVDPWAALLPETRDLLRRAAVKHDPWVGVMVIWDRKGDPQTVSEEPMFRSRIEHFLARDLEGRAAVRFTEVETYDDFRVLLPAVAHSAARYHLRHAAARPPEGPAPARPHISGSLSIPGLVRPGG
jgi:FxsC-like protein